MKRFLLTIAFVTATASPAFAMDVASFLTKAEAAQARGAMAMFSRDARDVMTELNEANRSLRNERLAAEAAGRTPAYCPPQGGALSPEEIIAAMRAIPAAERQNTEVRDALRAAYAERFPCR